MMVYYRGFVFNTTMEESIEGKARGRARGKPKTSEEQKPKAVGRGPSRAVKPKRGPRPDYGKDLADDAFDDNEPTSTRHTLPRSRTDGEWLRDSGKSYPKQEDYRQGKLDIRVEKGSNKREVRYSENENEAYFQESGTRPPRHEDREAKTSRHRQGDARRAHKMAHEYQHSAQWSTKRDDGCGGGRAKDHGPRDRNDKVNDSSR